MIIEVRDEYGEVIFNGDAEEFLFENDNDEEIEIALDELERKEVGSKTTLCGFFTDVFENPSCIHYYSV